jgi:hypothetical protein
MAGQYSHLQFFRRTPNALLARYFQERHGVLQEIAFDNLKEIEVEPNREHEIPLCGALLIYLAFAQSGC